MAEAMSMSLQTRWLLKGMMTMSKGEAFLVGLVLGFGLCMGLLIMIGAL